MSSQMISIVILAGIALFLFLQLRKVLGTRGGFEPHQGPEAGTGRGPAKARDFEVIDGGGTDHDIATFVDPDSDTGKALSMMKARQAGFEAGTFANGAKQAYEMILMSFENGDLTGVEDFLSPDIRDSFQGAIDARADQGLTIDANFVGVREVKFREVEFDEETGEAAVTLRFVGELTSVVKNMEGDVIEGDPNSVKKQTDIWTFSRIMGSDDPNWTLVATGQ